MGRRQRRQDHRPLIAHDDGSPFTAEEIGAVMVDAATKAGLHPALVHAIKVTGFIVTTENAHLFAEDDGRAWDAAVAEGELLYGAVDS